MKKLMLGVAPLLAVVAFMVVPAMASAVAPEWEVCTNVGAGHGTYKNSKCVVTGGTEAWEWEVVTAPVPIKSKGVGTSVLKTVNNTIECTAETDKGELLPPGTVIPTNTTGEDSAEATFTGCTLTGKLAEEKCKIKGKEITVEPDYSVLVAGGPTGVIDGFYPQNGGKTFAVISLTGTGCPKTSITVKSAVEEPLFAVVNGGELKFGLVNQPLEIEGEPARFEATTEQEGSTAKEAVRAS